MKYLSLLLITIITTAACTSSNQPVKAENATDAGREFVRAVLDGNFDRASFYLLQDSTNQLLFNQQKENYKKMKDVERRDYKDASIRPVGIIPENDSITIFRYYHSANAKDTTPLRIVRKDGQWLVDLKSVIKM